MTFLSAKWSVFVKNLTQLNSKQIYNLVFLESTCVITCFLLHVELAEYEEAKSKRDKRKEGKKKIVDKSKRSGIVSSKKTE